MFFGYSKLGCMLIASLAFLIAANGIQADTIQINPADIAIVLPASPEPAQRDAAEELQHHFKLILGANIEIQEQTSSAETANSYVFHVAIAPPDDNKAFEREEARWRVTPKATYFYGEDHPHTALYAVYSFLEDQLGVRWIQPGDIGISHETSKNLQLKTGQFNWVPAMEMRKIRPYAREGRDYPILKAYVAEYADFMPTHEENDKKAREVRQWQLRMRMGGHSQINYGHAFVTWWDKFSETHPEYFALNKWGEREPELRVKPTTPDPQYTVKDKISIKICPSNTAVADQLVQDWVKRGMRSKWVNACLNDQAWGYCRCDDCKALDAHMPDEPFMDHMTDRYVFLANEVAKRAKQHNPDAGAVMYAYDSTLQPPRNIKLEPNIAVVIVPTSLDIDNVNQLFNAWNQAGAKQVLMRPNYPTYFNTIAMPIGHEKQMYDVFQISRKNGAVGADYDALIGLWPYTGISDYTLAKTFVDPSVPFETWENEYLEAYGPASEDIRQYHHYWRNEVWDKRLAPDLNKIVKKGRYYNFARGLTWSLAEYYKESDFDKTDAILNNASKKELSTQHRTRLDQLILANQNSRLVFKASITRGNDKFSHSRDLLQFRNDHIDATNVFWFGMFAAEARFGDLAKTKIAKQLESYPLPWIETGVSWRFRIDPDDVGLDQSWQALSWLDTAEWDNLRTDFYWDNPYRSDTPPELMKKVKGYDGIGWYATQMRIPDEFKDRRALLYFGAVDESCWVYVNGKLAGSRIFAEPSDSSTPFEIDITDQINWSQPIQNISVRVEDKSGPGGICKRVWLVSKDTK